MKAQEGDNITRNDTSLGRFYPITLPDGTEVRWPSVTTIEQAIAKPALIQWAARVEHEVVAEAAAQLYADVAGTPPMKELAFKASLDARIGKVRAYKKEMAKAADIGTQAHARIEWMLRKELGQTKKPEPKCNEKAEWAVMAFEDWRRSVDLKPIFVERRVYSIEHEAAGTLDLYAEVNGTLTVCDWKTSKGVYGEALIQNAAYRHFLREMGLGNAKAGLILRLPKVDTDPQFEAIDVEARATETYGILPGDAERYLFELFLAAKTLWWAAYRDNLAWRAKRDAERGAS
jgi:hypothetical protein